MIKQMSTHTNKQGDKQINKKTYKQTNPITLCFARLDPDAARCDEAPGFEPIGS